MEISRERLKNGLKVMNYHMPWLETFSMAYFFKAGSIDEGSKELHGISHFLEHMMFNGSSKYPNKNEAVLIAEDYGLYQNAWTYYDSTSYLVSGISKYKKIASEMLNDRVTDPLLRTEDIEYEKLIITEEIDWGNDDPGRKLWRNLTTVLYKNTQLEHDVIGTKKSINGFTRKMVVDYKKRLYSSSNIVFVTAGDMTMKESIEIAKSAFPENVKGKANRRSAIKPIKSRTKKIHFEKKNDLDQSLVSLAFHCEGLDGKNIYPIAILAQILDGGKSGVLNREITIEKGLTTAIGMAVMLLADTGAVVIEAEFDNDKAGKLFKELKKELEKAKNGKIAKQDFDRAKSSALASYEYMYEASVPFIDFDSFAHRELVTGREFNPDEEIEKLNAVTFDEVVEAANEIFNFNTYSASIIGKDEKVKEKLLIDF